MTTLLELVFRDPVVSRDGRPFGVGQGNRMRSVEWLLPSVVSGSLRTMVGKAAGKAFTKATSRELRHLLSVSGSFPISDGRLYLPAPKDCVLQEDENRKIHPARPRALQDGAGCDLPEGLLPVLLEAEFKPASLPSWWGLDAYAKWLVNDPAFAFDHTFLGAPEVESRTHVSLNPKTGAAKEAELFTTEALPLTHLRRYGATSNAVFKDRFAEVHLTVRVRAKGWCAEVVSTLNGFHPLGGERRLVHWKAVPNDRGLWSPPQKVVNALEGNPKKVRMILATPAIFRDGWKPGWLNDQLKGTPPGASVTLQLVGVCNGRWRAVSGWSLAKPRGPKPIRRMAPSGSVYFFKTLEGDPSTLKDRWLEAVSDDPRDQEDGFGLALWGIW